MSPAAASACGVIPHRGSPRGGADPVHWLERLESTSAGRDRRQRAVRLTVHTPPDRNRLSVEEVLPMALTHRRIRHLPKAGARRALARMNPSPVRRKRRGVRGEGATRRTTGRSNLHRHRTAVVLQQRGDATQFHHGPPRPGPSTGGCPNTYTLGPGMGRTAFPPLPGEDRAPCGAAASPRRRPGCAGRRTCGRGPCSGLRRCTSRSLGSRPAGAPRSRWRPRDRRRAGSRRCRTCTPRG